MNRAQTEAYLKRIGMEPDLDHRKPGFDLLCRLQYAHVTHVPYENLDILRGVPLVLEEDALYDKIVVRRRGGYCFELNCLYNALLRALGYETECFLARYLRGQVGVQMRRHRIILARSPYFDGRVMCDVGIGDRAPRHALLFREGIVQKQFGETYRFDRDEQYGWIISDFHKGEWIPFFGFTEEKQFEVDYIMPSFWCEAHPASPFNKTNIVSLKTEMGRKTIADMTFRVFDGDTVTERTMAPGEVGGILEREFGIVLA